MQVRYTGSYWTPRFSIVPTQSVAADADIFDNYTHVVVRMYTVKSEECTNYWYDTISMRNADNSSTVASATKIRQNEWVDYAFPISQLVNFSYWPIDENGNLGSTKTNASFIGHAESKIVTEDSTDAAHKGVYYVASVYVANMAEVTATGDTLGAPVTLSATVNSENQDLSKATLRIKNPDGTIMNVQGNSFTPNVAGNYEITLLGDGFIGSTSVYFASAEEEISDILTFTGENYADYLTAKGTADFAWSESANSMQITYTAGTYCGVTFKNLPWSYAWAKNKGYGYIAVEVYAVGDTTDMYDSTLTSTVSLGHFRTNLGSKMVLCEEGGKKTDGNSDNKWVTVVLPLECLQQDTFQLYDQSGNTLARLYVRSMQLKEAKLTVGAVSSVDGGAFIFGENFTVSATTSSGAAVDMSVNTNYVYVLSTTGYGTGNIAGSAAGTTSIASDRGETQYVWVTDTESGEIGYTVIALSLAS